MRKWLVGGIGRRGVGVPWVQEPEYVAGSGYGYQVSRSHRRTAADVVSVPVWREECGPVLGTASRGRKWARREQCCSVSWDGNAWRVGGHNGRLARRHGNAILTLHSDQFLASEFGCCGCCANSREDGANCRDEGDVWPGCFLARLGWQRWQEG